MRLYAHAPSWLQKILNVKPYRAICQLFPEGSNLLSCVRVPRIDKLSPFALITKTFQNLGSELNWDNILEFSLQ